MSKTISQLGDTAGKYPYALASDDLYKYYLCDTVDALQSLTIKNSSINEVLPNLVKPFIVLNISGYSDKLTSSLFTSLEAHIRSVFTNMSLEYDPSLSRWSKSHNLIRWCYLHKSFKSLSDQKQFWSMHPSDLPIEMSYNMHQPCNLSPIKFTPTIYGIDYSHPETDYYLTGIDSDLIVNSSTHRFKMFDEYDVLYEYQEQHGSIPISMVHDYIKSTCRFFTGNGKPCWITLNIDENDQIEYTTLRKGHTVFSDCEFDFPITTEDGETTLKKEALKLCRSGSIKYNKVVFKPYGRVLPELNRRYMNLYHKPIFNEVSIDEQKMNAVQDLLSAICGDQPEVVEYVNKWIAQLIQFPERKPDTGLLFRSTEHGIGKNMLWDHMISPMLTKEYAMTVQGLKPVLERFNTSSMCKLLIIAEEGKEQTGPSKGAVYDSFKALVTCKDCLYEPKGLEKIRMDNYTRYVVLSNNDNPLGITAEDRRFVVIEGNDRIKREGRFTQLADLFNSPGFTNMLYTYYNNLDLNEFDPKDYPKTNARADMILNNVSDVKRFVFEKATEEDLDIVDKAELYNEYKEWCTTNGVSYKVNSIQFSKELKYFKVGICKPRVDGIQIPSYNLSNLLENIKEKLSPDLYNRLFVDINDI